MPNSLVQWYRQKFPAESANLSDDDITSRYVMQAPAYLHQNGVDIFTQYPDLAADWERIKRQQVEASIGVSDYAKQAAGSFGRGIVETIGAIPEAAATVAKKVTAGDVDLTGPTKRAVEGVANFVSPTVDPAKKEILDQSFLASKVPQGLGSAVGFMATGGAGGAVAKAAGMGARAAELTSIGGAGFASGFQEQYEAAKAKGVSEDEAFKAGLLGGGVGISEIVPLEKMLSRITHSVPGVTPKVIKDLIANTAGETIEETLQEGFQSAAGDIIAKNIIGYDKNRELLDSMAEDAAAGGVTGFLFSLLTHKIANYSHRRDTATDPEAKVEAERQQAGATPAGSTTTVTPPSPDPVDVAQAGYGIELKGLNDLLARELKDGPDAVLAEKDALSPDARRLYEIKLKAAKLNAANAPKAGPSQEDLDELKRVADELEAKQKTSSAAGDAAVTTEPDSAGTASTPPAPPVAPAAEATPTATAKTEGGDSSETEVQTGQQAQGQQEVAAPAAAGTTEEPKPAAAATAEPPAKTLTDMVQSYADTNTGEDSRKIISEGSTRAKSQFEAYGKINEILTAAKDRAVAKKESGVTLTPEDLTALAAADTDQTQAARVASLVELAKTGQLTPAKVDGAVKHLINLQTAAMNRMRSSTERVAKLTTSGKLSLADLVNAEDINYAPKSPVPGYFQIGDGTEASAKLDIYWHRYAEVEGEATTPEKKEELREQVASEIGKLLLEGSRVGSSRGHTYRLTAWTDRGGRVILVSGFTQAAINKAAPAKANSTYRFSVGPSAGKGGSRAPGASGNVGIRQLLDQGYTPLASMHMESPRGRVAGAFGSVDEYNAFLGSAAKSQAANIRKGFEDFENVIGAVAVTSDEDIVEAIDKAPEAVASLGTAFISDPDHLDLVLEIAEAAESGKVTTVDDAIKLFGPRIAAKFSSEGSPAELLGQLQRELEPILDHLVAPQNSAARKRIIHEFQRREGKAAEVARGNPAVSGGSDNGAGNVGGNVANAGQTAQSQESQAASQAPAGESPGGSSAERVAAISLEQAKIDSTREVEALRDAGLINKRYAKEAIDDIAGAESVEDVQAQVTALKSVIQDQLGTIADHQEPPSVNTDGTGVTRSRLIPDSTEAVRHNIESTRPARRGPASQAGILGEMSKEAIERDYTNVNEALTRIVEAEAVATPSRIGSLVSAIADSMHQNVALTGVTLRYANDPAGPPQAATYRYSTSEVVVNLAKVRDAADLHLTLVHELLHAYTTRMRLRADAFASTLSPEERGSIRLIEQLMAVAKGNGVTWQQSGSEDPRVQFDEFVAAVFTDSEVQGKLAGIPMPTVTQSTVQAKNLWEAFKAAVARLLERALAIVRDKTSNKELEKGDLLDNAVAAIEAIVSNYNESTAAADRIMMRPTPLDVGTNEAVRYRNVDGVLKDSRDITVEPSAPDAAVREGQRMMATTNEVDHTFGRMLSAWQAAGSAAAFTRTFDKFVGDMVNSLFTGTVLTPTAVRTEINSALNAQGAPSISTTTTFADLEQRGEAPKAARDALVLHQRMQQKFAEQAKVVEDEFGKKNIAQKIADAAAELQDVTERYDDLTVIGREYVKEIRRGVNDTVDTGAYAIASKLGATGVKAGVDAARARIQGNIVAHTDALQALAELGLDFSLMRAPGPNTLTPAAVQAAVQASTNPSLARLKADQFELAVAIEFARKRPLVMDMLAVRRKGQMRLALKKIIEIAKSNRPDAHDLAVSEIGKLPAYGALAQRIVNQLREVKAEHRELLDRANQYAEWLDFYAAAKPVLDAKIRDLERRLAMEASHAGRQWDAVHGASYFVPTSATQDEASLFVNADTNPSKTELRLGDGFDPVKLDSDIKAMRDWLAANKNLAGSANYELLARMADKLQWVYHEGANFQIQRGPLGWIVKVAGDIATQAEFTGLQAGREFARQVRRFNTLYEAHLRTTDRKEFHRFDGLARKAMKATGVESPDDFWSRFYDKAFGFLEARQDLLNGSLTEAQQSERSIQEAVKFISSDPAMSRPGAAVAVTELLRQAVANTQVIQKMRQDMGLKVKETLKDGRVIFREAIGNPAHTMSRMISQSVRALVADKMAVPEAWESPFSDASGVQRTGLSKAVVSELYANNRPELVKAVTSRFTPEVLAKFVRPLVEKVGQSNFFGPTVNGVKDRAKRGNVIHALNASAGDMILFAELLHAAEGGTPETLADFVGETLGTFQRYYTILNDVSSIKGQTADDGGEIGRAFLDARQGEDFPHQWLEYRKFGNVDQIRYVRILATQAAYGSDAGSAMANLGRMEQELKILNEEYEAAMKLPAGPARAAALNDGGLRRARERARSNLSSVAKMKAQFAALNDTMNGAPQEDRTFIQLVSLMAASTVQGITTSLVDTVSMVETPFRKFGFSREALSFILGSWKNYGFEALGSLMQAIGTQLYLNKEFNAATRTLNSSGLADIDALTKGRGISAFTERYAEELGDEMTLSAIRARYRGEPLVAAGALAAGVTRRVNKAVKVGLELGIGAAKDKDRAFASLKLAQPFSQNGIWMSRAVARQWLATVDTAVKQATEYFRAHPADAADASFRFSPKELQYATRGLLGFAVDDRSFEYLNETLWRNGITLEEAARRALRGEPALTREQVHAVTALGQSEILLNSGVLTRPTGLLASEPGRMMAPLIGWSIYKMTDLVKTTRNPKGQAGSVRRFFKFGEPNAFRSATIAFALGVLPTALAYALLRDKYEEEVLGKKANVLPLQADGTLPMALLDNLNRVGVFGMAGDVANSLFNVSTAREFSVDSRVFFISSLMSIGRIAGTIYNQEGTTTYQTVWRPFLQSIGGSGYLQNFDAINNLLDFDNGERRVVRRINVYNQLRAVGRSTEMDVRTSRGGMTAVPNPIKPWVGQMALAAFSNDPSQFQEAYNRAVEAAAKRILDDPKPKPDADPIADVAEAFERIHPLRSVFGKAPTTMQYQQMISELGDKGEDVAAAIRNFNAYGAQIPKGRGKEGLKPYYGTDRKAATGGDYRSLTTGSGMVPRVTDYRSLTTLF